MVTRYAFGIASGLHQPGSPIGIRNLNEASLSNTVEPMACPLFLLGTDV